MEKRRNGSGRGEKESKSKGNGRLKKRDNRDVEKISIARKRVKPISCK